jgi:hypothetical protein
MPRNVRQAEGRQNRRRCATAARSGSSCSTRRTSPARASRPWPASRRLASVMFRWKQLRAARAMTSLKADEELAPTSEMRTGRAKMGELQRSLGKRPTRTSSREGLTALRGLGSGSPNRGSSAPYRGDGGPLQHYRSDRPTTAPKPQGRSTSIQHRRALDRDIAAQRRPPFLDTLNARIAELLDEPDGRAMPMHKASRSELFARWTVQPYPRCVLSDSSTPVWANHFRGLELVPSWKVG